MKKRILWLVPGIILILGITIFVTIFTINNIHKKERNTVNDNQVNWQPLITSDDELQQTLAQLCARYQQPAMACALVNNNRILVQAAAGNTVYGQGQPVDIDMRFHIGSTTKSMTALLIQMLVSEGKLSYETTLEQALPDIPMREEYRHVSISNLLLSKAGIIPFQRSDIEDPAVFQKLWYDIPAAFDNLSEQRHQVACFALDTPPFNQPGTQAVYSNVGWAIAGHIIEEAVGKSFETVLQEKIFQPLGMSSARLGGWPASESEPGQPRGHYPVTGGSPMPQDLVDVYIFPGWMNPSGGVHCTITDYALYVMENLAGLEGHGKLLNKKGYENIHNIHMTTKVGDMYLYTPPSAQADDTVNMSYGWGITTFRGNNLSAADGSGGTFYAIIMVYPALDVAFAGFTNCGDGSSALQEAIFLMTGLADDPLAASTAASTSTPVDSLAEKAQGWVTFLAAGEFGRAVTDFDATMAAQFPADRMQATWDSLVRQVGNFGGIKNTMAVKQDGLDYITVTCTFQKMAIDIQLAYSPEGKIAGLEIKPAG